MSEEKRLLEYVLSTANEGDPDSVIEAIDRYASRNFYLIHIGQLKAEKVASIIQESQARRVLELGTNFGYSAITMAKNMKAGKGEVLSIELSSTMARLASRLIKFAGLDDRIRILNGDSTKMIARLKPFFDLVFIDHEKDLYLKDLRLIEKYRLIDDGGIVLADNTGMYRYALRPYLDHVKFSGKYVSQTLEGTTVFGEEVHDAMELSIYMKR